jgi:hypothetical protein
MQYECQKLWRSAIKLVSRNRWRGYCIALALVEGNLEVSTLHGKFRIKEPLHDKIQGKDKIDSWAIYESLGYLGIGIDAMHPFFEELREYNKDVKSKMSHGQQQQEEVAELTFEDQEHIDVMAAGCWLVTINRNGAMHPFIKKLAALTGKYTRSDIIKLLHYKLPMYLHVVQALCRSEGY